MPRADEYRNLAAEAKKRAEAAQDATVKAMYDQLARSWDDLAAEAERHRRGSTPKP
jgi:hypothetical protein